MFTIIDGRLMRARVVLALLLALPGTLLAQPPFLVDADWLAEHIEDDKLNRMMDIVRMVAQGL
jgi:hypothetical protein